MLCQMAITFENLKFTLIEKNSDIIKSFIIIKTEITVKVNINTYVHHINVF